MPLSVMQAEDGSSARPRAHRYRLRPISVQRTIMGRSRPPRLLKTGEEPDFAGRAGRIRRPRGTRAWRHLRKGAGMSDHPQPCRLTYSLRPRLACEDRTFTYGCDDGFPDRFGKALMPVVAIGTEIGESLHYGRGRHWAEGDADPQVGLYRARSPPRSASTARSTFRWSATCATLCRSCSRQFGSPEPVTAARTLKTWSKVPRRRKRQALFDTAPATS